MTVQDDERERELVRLFNLDWDVGHQRDGTDASLTVDVGGFPYRFDVEVKSTTKDSVGTARDVGLDHIRKWQNKFFIIGFYGGERGRPELRTSLCLTPEDIAPWISALKQKIEPDFRLAERAAHRLQLEDLHAVCEPKQHYSLLDAQKLHKMQWSSDQYRTALDVFEDGKRFFSSDKMLEILKLRLRYIAERGATLNNPKLNTIFLRQHLGTGREIKGSTWALTVRQIASDFIRDHPAHPAVRLAYTSAGNT